VKLWTSGPFFRHERPQAGRFRQFHQVDAESIGSGSPLVDAELIILLSDLLSELGVPGRELRLGSSARSRRGLPTSTCCALPQAARGEVAKECASAGS
jgi:histidyl-tRNA synthetase